MAESLEQQASYNHCKVALASRLSCEAHTIFLSQEPALLLLLRACSVIASDAFSTSASFSLG